MSWCTALRGNRHWAAGDQMATFHAERYDDGNGTVACPGQVT